MPEYKLDTALVKDLARSLDSFTLAYIEAAMWTLTGDDGEPLDYLGLHDIAAESIDRMRTDCAAFQRDCEYLLEHAGSPAQNGHDFWLTRNRHGAGFWDRGYPEAIDRQLTDAAHAYGECVGYVGDDGRVYFD